MDVLRNNRDLTIELFETAREKLSADVLQLIQQLTIPNPQRQGTDQNHQTVQYEEHPEYKASGEE